MAVPYLTDESLAVVDARLEEEFRALARPGLIILVKSPVRTLLQNIRDRQCDEESPTEKAGSDEILEGLLRLVRALNGRYDAFVENVRHLIAVYEGVERLLVPKEFRG